MAKQKSYFNHKFSEGYYKDRTEVLLPLEECEPIPSNREATEARIQKIITPFEAGRFQAVEATFRSDLQMSEINPKTGSNYLRYGVPEGGGRLAAFKLMHERGDTHPEFGDFSKIPTILHYNASFEDEAAIAWYCDQDKHKQTAATRARFLLDAKDPLTLSIVECAKQEGFEVFMEIGRAKKVDYLIGNISSISNMINLHGLEAFRTTLQYIKTGWNGMRGALEDNVLGGFLKFSALLQNPEEIIHGQFDEARMFDLMKNGELAPFNISEDASTEQNKVLTNKNACWARSFVKLYNISGPTLTSSKQLVLKSLLTKVEVKFIKKNEKYSMKDGEIDTLKTRKRRASAED